jgi:CRISP-associated protein Cas1
MKQYELESSALFCLRFARSVVEGRIRNGVAVLKRFRANHPEAFSQALVAEVEEALERAGACSTVDGLRGVEGSAAAAYFRCLRRMVPEDLGFEGRRRRPPRDPVNSLLSFGYVLVSNELHSLLDGIGFDPYIGFYHRLDYGRPSLALDLLEEFRPALVDRFTLALLNRRTIRKRTSSRDRRADCISGRKGSESTSRSTSSR